MSVATHKLTIRSRVTCPHCWHEYAPEETFYVAEHSDLLGDAKLGENEPLRFLPSRFTPDGDALDLKGVRTSRLACPNCHLEVPRALYQIPPIFFSILGGPASGKSFFLAAMSWKLRQSLPIHFGVAITDSDPKCNMRLHAYEELLFLNPNQDKLVKLEKTEEQGDMYSRVIFGTQNAIFPKPFLFTLQPSKKHPVEPSKAGQLSRVICLYDNAGESFLPGADRTDTPVTRHLALSRCILFLFDPTQDPRFRKRCEGLSEDPQMQPRTEKLARENSVRQDTILLEAIQRVRRHAGLREDVQHQRPMIVVVTKWDSWKNLLPSILTDGEMPSAPFVDAGNGNTMYLDGDRLDYVSREIENLFREIAPEIVAAAEGFAQPLIFLPASGIGQNTTQKGKEFFVRPKDINPVWAEVPLLYAVSLCRPELVSIIRQR